MPEQPDLNLRNQDVVEELEEIMEYWLHIGVDGFRIDAVAHFFEDTELGDEPSTGSGSGYTSLDHTKTFDQAEVVDLLKKFRKVLDTMTAEDEENPRIMMTEAYLPPEKLARYYGQVEDHIGSISQMPLNFNLLNFKTAEDLSPDSLKTSINNYLSALPNSSWSNFALSNHDNARPASKFGTTAVDALNMIVMMLPGTPFTYYGDEIGMVDGSASGGDKRDPYRTPMQWTGSEGAGFTEAGSRPWLNVNGDYKTKNVEAIDEAGTDDGSVSHLDVYREMAALRHTETVLYGDTYMMANSSVFALARIKKGNPGYLVVTNFEKDDVTLNLVDICENMPVRGTLTFKVAGKPEEAEPQDEGFIVGGAVPLQDITIKGYQSLLVTFVPSF